MDKDIKEKWLWPAVGIAAIAIGGLYMAASGNSWGQFGAARQALVRGFAVTLAPQTPGVTITQSASGGFPLTVLALQSSVDEDIALKTLALQFDVTILQRCRGLR